MKAGWTLKINPDDDLYKKSTMMIQGNLSPFEEDEREGTVVW